ncbi:hypothetical protein FE783_19345 [Paenibacillus mesophilus]|uniref:hypothetical protein n=1 Tax=Paenibacillus mesophilus TaxID=2582849 RepID=UPI00110D54BF|nr:hypothetical protein [Paenibacillus mesophilus]TMV48110.1 hypothetical protein FE783_19345 [Paenibacillus mesophilus]
MNILIASTMFLTPSVKLLKASASAFTPSENVLKSSNFPFFGSVAASTVTATLLIDTAAETTVFPAVPALG